MPTTNVPTFDDLMTQGFGVVTVMNAVIYKLNNTSTYSGRAGCHHAGATGGALTPANFECTGLCLDTLKIANLNQEGPTKTITGGQYANPLIKYGKTMRMEAQDALGRAGTLVEFFGCEYIEGQRLSVTDRFPGAFCIEGDTFFINQKTGKKETVHILIPQFLPDGIFNLTQDAEGDATVFDLNGSISVTTIQDAAEEAEGTSTKRDIFYEIRANSWFSGATVKAGDATTKVNEDYHIETSSEE